MAKPMVAIVGRPNVGKSMLFNKLAGKRLSIVEDTPGVTRDRLYADCDWNGREFTIVDTGGIEPRNDNEILQFMRGQAEIAIDNADVIVLVCDIRTGVTADDADMLAWLRHYEVPHLLVATKCDKLGKTALNEAAAQLIRSPAVAPGTACVLFSSLKGEGREALWAQIIKLAFGEEGKG